MSFEIEILEEKKNPLIDRTEVKFRVNHFGMGTPNRMEIRSKLASMLQTNEKYTIIQKIKGHFGDAYSLGIVHAYKNKEDLDFYVPFHIQARNIPKEKREEIIKLRKRKEPYKQLFEY